MILWVKQKSCWDPAGTKHRSTFKPLATDIYNILLSILRDGGEVWRRRMGERVRRTRKMSEEYRSEVWVRSVVEKDGQKDGQEDEKDG